MIYTRFQCTADSIFKLNTLKRYIFRGTQPEELKYLCLLIGQYVEAIVQRTAGQGKKFQHLW